MKHISPRTTQTIAGIEDRIIDVGSLSGEEKLVRAREIADVVIATARAKTARLQQEEQRHLIVKLTTRSYTLQQIRAAARQVEMMDTAHLRPLAWENWERAFGEPMYSAQQVAARMREAYERGRREGGEKARPEECGPSEETQELLTKLRAMWMLEEERDRLRGQLAACMEELERMKNVVAHQDEVMACQAERINIMELERGVTPDQYRVEAA